MAIGDIAHRATLLIASVNGSDVIVDVYLGTPACPGCGKYYNPVLRHNTAWVLDLDPADAHSHVVVSSSGLVVVQLAVDEGKKKSITWVTVPPE